MSTSQSRFSVDANGRVVFIRFVDEPTERVREKLNEVAEPVTSSHLRAYPDLYAKFLTSPEAKRAVDQSRNREFAEKRGVRGKAGQKITDAGAGSNASQTSAEAGNAAEDEVQQQILSDIKSGKAQSMAKREGVDPKREQSDQERMDASMSGPSYYDHTTGQIVRGKEDPNKLGGTRVQADIDAAAREGGDVKEIEQERMEEGRKASKKGGKKGAKKSGAKKAKRR